MDASIQHEANIIENREFIKRTAPPVPLSELQPKTYKFGSVVVSLF